MTCRDVRELADSFLGEELLTETNHDILRHLDTCPTCREEIDTRRRLRGALRAAFDRAPDLHPSPDFAQRLRGAVREAAGREPRRWTSSQRWLAVAAGLVLAIGTTAAVLLWRSPVPMSRSADALAQDAVGDHRHCALQVRPVRNTVPLDEAAARFDEAYRLLLTVPPEDVSTRGGPAEVIERHSCAYAGRRFGHVILRYRGRVVSLLMTAGERASAAADAEDAIPHVIEQPADGLSVVAVNGPGHVILLVSDLERGELAELSRAVSVPLARRLAASGTGPSGSQAARARALDAALIASLRGLDFDTASQ